MTGGIARTLNQSWFGISERDRMLRVVQPGLLGLTDGTLSTLAPIFAAAYIAGSRTDDHHHVACRRCGRVEDIDVPVEEKRLRDAARAAGYEPEHTDVVVVGLCSDCRAR